MEGDCRLYIHNVFSEQSLKHNGDFFLKPCEFIRNHWNVYWKVWLPGFAHYISLKSKFKLAVKNRGQSQNGQRRNKQTMGLQSCCRREMRELKKQLKKTDLDAGGLHHPVTSTSAKWTSSILKHTLQQSLLRSQLWRMLPETGLTH